MLQLTALPVSASRSAPSDSRCAAAERTGFLGTTVTKRYSLSYYISAGQIPAALLPNHYRRFIVSDSATAATTALPV